MRNRTPADIDLPAGVDRHSGFRQPPNLRGIGDGAAIDQDRTANAPQVPLPPTGQEDPRRPKRVIQLTMAGAAGLGVLAVFLSVAIVFIRHQGSTAKSDQAVPANATAPDSGQREPGIAAQALPSPTHPVATARTASVPAATPTSTLKPGSGLTHPAGAPTATRGGAAQAPTGGNSSGVKPSPTSPTGPTGSIVGDAGKCIDVLHSGIADGTTVDLSTCLGSAAQSWTIGTDGTVRALGKCLDAAGDGTADGTPVQLWSCDGSANQKWMVSSGHDLINPIASKCLDVKDNKTDDGTPLQIWGCSGGINQKWYPEN